MIQKRVFSLFTTTGITQLLPLLILPILLVKYTPEDFGKESLFSAIYVLAAGIFNLKYDQAILVCDDDEIERLFKTSLVLTLAFSVLSYLCIIFLKIFISEQIDLNYFLMLFFAINLQQINSTAYLLSNRVLDIRLMNVFKATPVLIYSFLTLFIWSVSIPDPLVVARFISLVSASIVILVILISKKKIRLKKIEYRDLCILLSKYNQYPKKILPGKILNLLSNRSMIFIISHIYGTYYTGIYALAKKILLLPESIIATPLGDYLRRKLYYGDKVRRSRVIIMIQNRIILYLILSVVISSAIYFIVPFILERFFDIKWIEAGKIIQILTVGYFVSFLMIPLSSIFRIFEKENSELIFQITYFICVLTPFVIFQFIKLNPISFFQITNVFRILSYSIGLILIYRILRR